MLSPMHTPYGAPGNKFSQGPITVSEILAFPAIQAALADLRRWSRPIKDGVAGVLSNRTCFIRTHETAEETKQFTKLMAKVNKVMDSDPLFAKMMDPCYVIVDFGGVSIPADYYLWLEEINATIGGSPVGAVGPSKFNMTAGGNQPIMFIDPKLNNINLLHVDTREHADYVADQLKVLGGLSSWVLETLVPPIYR